MLPLLATLSTFFGMLPLPDEATFEFRETQDVMPHDPTHLQPLVRDHRHLAVPRGRRRGRGSSRKQTTSVGSRSTSRTGSSRIPTR